MSLFLLWSLLFTSVQPISLHVSPRQGFSPLTVEAEIRIPRHEANREACVTLGQGEMLEDSSCWEVSGASSPIFKRKWQGLQVGRHYAQARLRRGKDTVFSNLVELTVLGEEPVTVEMRTRILVCRLCDNSQFAPARETPTACPVCKEPAHWRVADADEFTPHDRRFLHALRIGSD